jgi:hypothetical protein
MGDAVLPAQKPEGSRTGFFSFDTPRKRRGRLIDLPLGLAQPQAAVSATELGKYRKFRNMPGVATQILTNILNNYNLSLNTESSNAMGAKVSKGHTRS